MQEQLMFQQQQQKFYSVEQRANQWHYHLDGPLEDPDQYLDLCQLLRTAGPQDEVVIHFNSGGGQVRTGNQIINAIHESEANVVGFIEHDCGSMCTFIFLACDTWCVSKYAEWFSHTVSGGNYGKESETYEAAQFLRKQTHKRIKDEYAGFLLQEEIDLILKGGDIYLDAEEIMDRLQTFEEYRQQQYQEQCGDEEDFEPSISLQDMIEQSVEKVLVKYLAALENKVDPVVVKQVSNRFEPVMDDLESHGWNGEA